jgi:hypothetical protein
VGKAKKQLEDMTEPELRDLTRRCLNALKERLPDGVMYTILFSPFGRHGVGQYGSNCRREDMVKMLRETADRVEFRQDVPR